MNKDLKELKHEISSIKHPRLNKIFESEKIDRIISKVQDIYHRISDKLILKYNLSDELKQGKIFTILIALIVFILLIVLSVFFAVTLNSILGIGLLFSFVRQIVFCVKWGYTIVKNKGKIIKKYLSNLFPNSILLQETKERKKIPLYEEYILYQIEDFIEQLNKSNIDLEIEKEITLKLKEIVELLHLNMDFKEELHSLEYKQDIAMKLSNINELYLNNVRKQECQKEFSVLKNDVLEQIEEVETKVYVKKR